ncbi:DUF4190 domain-containing protein [Nocardia sp. NPDC052001]|uniref:DUF4190 domain-containing protein n=1 Tax=Nocardia sp. NPDC052001 TaxID=3154853 RepID=UPI00342A4CA3
MDPNHPNSPDKPVGLDKQAGGEQPAQPSAPDPTVVAWSSQQPPYPGAPAQDQQAAWGQPQWPNQSDPAYGAQQPYPGQPGYTAPGGYPEQPGYTAPGGYPEQPGYAPAGGFPADPYGGSGGYQQFPPPQYPQPYPPQGPAGPPQGTNGFAIAALITGLLGMCLLSVPFGVISLSQIKDRNQQGKGLAITGLILTGVWALVGVIVFAVGVADTKDSVDSISPPPSFSMPAIPSFSVPALPTTTAPSTSGAGYTLLRNLKDGDCVNGVHRKVSISGATVTSCTSAHDGEVFLNFNLPSFQGDQQSKDYAETKCAEVFDRIDSKVSGLSYLYYRPHSQSEWNTDPSVQCIAIQDDETKLNSKLPR